MTNDQIEQLAQNIDDAYSNGPDNPKNADEVEKIIRSSVTTPPEATQGAELKTLTIARPAQIAPGVVLKVEWRDNKNRRCSQYLTDAMSEEDAQRVVEFHFSATKDKDELLREMVKALECNPIDYTALWKLKQRAAALGITGEKV